MKFFYLPLLILSLLSCEIAGAEAESKQTDPSAVDEPEQSPAIGKHLDELRTKYAEQEAKWDEYLESLNAVEQKLSDTNLPQSYYGKYLEVVVAWREAHALNEKIETLFTTSDSLLKERTEFIQSLPESQQGDIHNKINELQTEFNRKRINRAESAQKRAHAVFYAASKKRAELIDSLHRNRNYEVQTWSKLYFQDLWLEIDAVPLRWFGLFELRLQRIQTDINAGMDGWINISRQLFYLLFYLGTFLFSFRFFGKISVGLDRIRDELARKSHLHERNKHIVVLLQRISPYLPWLGTAALLKFGEHLLRKGYVAELSILLPYIEYYIYYRIFRILINRTLSTYGMFAGHLAIFRDKQKLLRTSRIIGLYFLFAITTLHTFQTTVGEGFIYLWLQSTTRWMSVLVFGFISYLWREEFEELLGKLSQNKYESLRKTILGKAWGIIFSLPVAITLISYLLIVRISRWSERFEIIKTISTEIFRKKIESKTSDASTTSITISDDYCEKFSACAERILLTANQEELLNETIKTIDAWANDIAEDHIIAFVGEPGLGKTTLLHALSEKITSHNVISKDITRKITTEEELLAEFPTIFSTETKTVILLDQCQNLFLSRVGGFEGFKAFLRRTQENSDNIFWCLTFNNYSWDYLQSVLDKTRYFNRIYRLQKWKETELRAFIQEKHEQTGYAVSFDEILVAAKSEGDFESIIYIESKYYRLLWEESLGNPTVAQEVWLNCLKPYPGKQVKVGIPRDRSEVITGLPDDFYFVLANIVRHENASISDIISSTRLSEDVVVNATKTCLESGYLTRDFGRTRLHPLWQHSIFATLRRKNFIYG